MAEKQTKQDKRLAIIEATLTLIAENGFHGAPTSKNRGNSHCGDRFHLPLFQG
jgi:hypothetical protein